MNNLKFPTSKETTDIAERYYTATGIMYGREFLHGAWLSLRDSTDMHSAVYRELVRGVQEGKFDEEIVRASDSILDLLVKREYACIEGLKKAFEGLFPNEFYLINGKCILMDEAKLETITKIKQEE